MLRDKSLGVSEWPCYLPLVKGEKPEDIWPGSISTWFRSQPDSSSFFTASLAALGAHEAPGLPSHLIRKSIAS